MSGRPRLALLDASHDNADTRRDFRRELAADLVEFPLVEEQYPTTFDVDGVVISGSKSSVYWDEPWLEPTREWLGTAIDRGIPALGVCFGHQLLADLLGGTVEGMEEFELGYREVRKTASSPILADLDERFSVFLSHQDVVTEPPAEATVIAENDYGIQGFQHEHVFGVQSHPEYDSTTARGTARSKEGKVPPAQLEAVLDGITEEAAAAAAPSKTIFDRFVRYVGREGPSG